MSDLAYTDLLPLGPDTTPYRLLTTEGDRRRARIELERKPAGPQLAAVKPLDAYRNLAGG